MSGFGNYLGATMGTSTNEEGNSGAVYDNAFVTNSNYPKRAALIGDDGKFVQLDSDLQDENRRSPQVPAEQRPSRRSSRIDIGQQHVSGGAGQALGSRIPQLGGQVVRLHAQGEGLAQSRQDRTSWRKDWTEHGDTLKTTSEDFKETVNKTIERKVVRRECRGRRSRVQAGHQDLDLRLHAGFRRDSRIRLNRASVTSAFTEFEHRSSPPSANDSVDRQR